MGGGRKWAGLLRAAASVVVLAAVAAPSGPVGPVRSEAVAAEQAPTGAAGVLPMDGGGRRAWAQPPTTPAVPAVPAGGRTAAVTPAGGQAAVPATVFAAYRTAAAAVAASDPGCHLPWELLAAIGRVESGHADGGRVDAAGTTATPILGPALDGNGFAAIADTDGGAVDGDRRWDRAVGPMQFIPSTWAVWGADGNGDGRRDANNIHDAALAAGHYLCAGSRDLADPAQLDAAILGYNHSAQYLRTVKGWMAHYRSGAVAVADAPLPARPIPSGAVHPPTPTPTPSPSPAAPTPRPTPSPSSPSPWANPSPTAGKPDPTPVATPSGGTSPTPDSCPTLPAPSPTPGATVGPTTIPSAGPTPTMTATTTATATPSPTGSGSPTALPSPTATVPGGCPVPTAAASPSASATAPAAH
ncbi:lytic murein transglycosylase [Kitasatospora sp. NPDC051914]|uniref:lytic transglycosylase domain-containing protein n=1 Tax=Kitasatospora sp. NPDC051914 TaxID=3154945 RepID=UPI00343A6B38